MEEEINWKARFLDMQLENEVLRSQLKGLAEAREQLAAIPNLIMKLWNGATRDKTRLLFALMIIYWLLACAMQVHGLYKDLKGTGQ